MIAPAFRLPLLLVPFLFLALPAPIGAQTVSDSRPATATADTPTLRIGLLADVQYADKDTVGRRRYREADDKLRACVADLATRNLDFVVDLGDLIDGHDALTQAELDRMCAIYRTLPVPVRHVVGNHDLLVGRPALMRSFGLTTPYCEWRLKGWRFLVLDALEVSTLAPIGPEEKALAADYLTRQPKLQTYNGALTDRQLDWLRERLADVRRCGERAIVLCHLPTILPASNAYHLIWNHEQVAAILEQSGCVVAYLSGHDHAGGYAFHAGIHHLTMPGLVEAPEGGNGYGILEVYPDRLVLTGVGTVISRTMTLTAKEAEVQVP
jgi:manganese-dependent ADP-ribose/CDP-alcohol diphosphatase